ncbi:MAG: hypothetical protein HY077_00090 [Elusimicrobia bacterium]|nr:hypothetical protein [Elusimicrobiota bacterium]
MSSERLLQQLGPLSKLIVNEVIIQLKQDGFVLSNGVKPESTGASAQPDEDTLMNLTRAAELLDHSYFWLSRNYKRLGLQPSRIGGKLLFQKEDVFALVKRHKVKAPGRPRVQRLPGF